jgi:hypothetical protein
MPLQICEAEEDLDIAVAGWLWQLCNSTDLVWLHLNAFWHDNELGEADALRIELALPQLQVETCLLLL